MANKEIAVTEKNMDAVVDKVVINRINLKSDDSGQWNIGVDFSIKTPARTVPATVNFSEQHRASGQVTVTRAEIAAVANITEEQVRSVLTLAQTEGLVTQIAMGKLFPVLGLTPA